MVTNPVTKRVLKSIENITDCQSNDHGFSSGMETGKGMIDKNLWNYTKRGTASMNRFRTMGGYRQAGAVVQRSPEKSI